jgi:hypothetical protein
MRTAGGVLLAQPNRDNALAMKLETLANEQSAAKQQATSRKMRLRRSWRC